MYFLISRTPAKRRHHNPSPARQMPYGHCPCLDDRVYRKGRKVSINLTRERIPTSWQGWFIEVGDEAPMNQPCQLGQALGCICYVNLHHRREALAPTPAAGRAPDSPTGRRCRPAAFGPRAGKGQELPPLCPGRMFHVKHSCPKSHRQPERVIAGDRAGACQVGGLGQREAGPTLPPHRPYWAGTSGCCASNTRDRNGTGQPGYECPPIASN